MALNEGWRNEHTYTHDGKYHAEFDGSTSPGVSLALIYVCVVTDVTKSLFSYDLNARIAATLALRLP